MPWRAVALAAAAILAVACEREPERHALAGRATDAGGAPVAGVQVTAFLTAQDGRRPLGRGETDARGRFQLADLPARPDSLLLRGDRVLSIWLPVPGSSPAEIRCSVEHCRRFRLQLQSGPVDAFEIHDEDGLPLPVQADIPGGFEERRRTPLGAHDSARVFAVGERAATAVLYRKGVELARKSLVLLPGRVAILRW